MMHRKSRGLVLGVLTSLGFAFAAALPSPALAQQGPGDAHELTVEVTDIRGEEGELVIALFANRDGFPHDLDKAARVATVPLDEPRHTFDDLPRRAFVVVVFHDRNANGKLDRNVIGMPKEPIGLSNHKKLAPPKPEFEKAKVDVGTMSSVSINLIELGR